MILQTFFTVNTTVKLGRAPQNPLICICYLEDFLFASFLVFCWSKFCSHWKLYILWEYQDWSTSAFNANHIQISIAVTVIPTILLLSICGQYQHEWAFSPTERLMQGGMFRQCDGRQAALCRLEKNWQRLIHDYVSAAAVTTSEHIFFALSFFLLSPLLPPFKSPILLFC